MAWIKVRVTDDNDKRFVACYRDPECRQRSPAPTPPAVLPNAPPTARGPRCATGRDTTTAVARSQSPTTSRISGCRPSTSSPPPWPRTGPTSTSTSSPPSDPTHGQDPPLGDPALGHHHHRHRERPVGRQRAEVPHHSSPIAHGPGVSARTLGAANDLRIAGMTDSRSEHDGPFTHRRESFRRKSARLRTHCHAPMSDPGRASTGPTPRLDPTRNSAGLPVSKVAGTDLGEASRNGPRETRCQRSMRPRNPRSTPYPRQIVVAPMRPVWS